MARTNLAPLFGLVAAAALLIDYVMTVAVSTASAIAQIQSIVPAAYDYRIEIAVRVDRPDHRSPTCAACASPGTSSPSRPTCSSASPWRSSAIGVLPDRDRDRQRRCRRSRTRCRSGTEALGILLLLKAFAGGSVALTGVEAIANGVPAFKPPEARNAANTMTVMAVLLAILFVGLTIVAVALRPPADGGGRAVDRRDGRRRRRSATGRRWSTCSPSSTALILFLAANTSFNAFPRLAAILAEDGYMPRQFAFRGDRLAYSWGIVLLAAVAFGLLWAFGGDTHALIPLYSVGVFLCFTLSQAGMVRHWLRVREPGWRWRLAINAGGGVLTARRPGHRRVREVRRRRVPRGHPRPGAGRDDAVHRPPVRAVPGASSRSGPDTVVAAAAARGARGRADPGARPGRGPGDQRRRARSTTTSGRSSSRDDPDAAAARVRADFERQVPGVPLVVVESPYRALAGPLLAYLDVLDLAWPPDKAAPITFVVIPEYVARSWWERILYNQSAKRLRTMLLGPAAHGHRQRPVPARATPTT